jgi:glyoxylate/hydroxypyruvate reductase A
VLFRPGAQGFQDFLAASRILVCLLPLTPDTQGIMNRDTLSRLLPAATSSTWRAAATWSMADLITLIDNGHLAGATLDVFRMLSRCRPTTRSGSTRRSR